MHGLWQSSMTLEASNSQITMSDAFKAANASERLAVWYNSDGSEAYLLPNMKSSIKKYGVLPDNFDSVSTIGVQLGAPNPTMYDEFLMEYDDILRTIEQPFSVCFGVVKYWN